MLVNLRYCSGAGEGNRTLVFSLEVRYRTYTAPSPNFT
jgi:hypothetical protein